MDCSITTFDKDELLNIQKHISNIYSYLKRSKVEYILTQGFLEGCKSTCGEDCNLSIKDNQSLHMIYNYRLGFFKCVDTSFNKQCIFVCRDGGCAIDKYVADSGIKERLKPKACS